MAVPAEEYDQNTRCDGKENDAIGEDQPISQPGELAREKAILGQDGRQARKIREAGIGSHCQDEQRGNLDGYISKPVAEQTYEPVLRGWFPVVLR